jgi:UDP-N-acetylmuramate-alanine ligase
MIWDYFEFLGEMSKYFKTIGFTGTNGKSSSSALGIFAASKILDDFGIGIVGALVPDFGEKSYLINETKKAEIKTIFDYIFSGRRLDYRLVKQYYFFLEACEYQRHFLNLQLDTAIITTLELEHTDYFKDWEDYESAFLEMMEKVKEQVFVLKTLPSETILRHPKTAIVEIQHFDFQYLWGEHQQHNASLVFGLLSSLLKKEENTDSKLLRKLTMSIEQFHGIWRRMEYLARTEQ